MNFYQKIVKKTLENGDLNINHKILIVGGGNTDRNVFLELGFKNVIISNLDYDRGEKNYLPYEWNRQDAELLTYENESFDWVFTHAVLHHCASPHKAYCEMLRVAKIGTGVFESRDSLLIAIASKFGLVPNYELEAIVLNKGTYGGLRNSPIPNYIYRWTENDVEKTTNSYLPHYIHKFNYYYGLNVPTKRLQMSPSFLKRTVGKVASYFLPLFQFLFPKQCNDFAFIVSKKGQIMPWLKYGQEGLEFNLEYSKDKFMPEKYKS